MSCSLAHLHQQGSRYKALKERVDKGRLHMRYIFVSTISVEAEDEDKARKKLLVELEETPESSSLDWALDPYNE